MSFHCASTRSRSPAPSTGNRLTDTPDPPPPPPAPAQPSTRPSAVPRSNRLVAKTRLR
ncbi:hypothetical protein GXW82_09435 [Streptacidiphilus sp. 4-A2]|nr:hypothetical protein [Streptacidiphilus sp. 4-A2]